MKLTVFICALLISNICIAQDNVLTKKEAAEGWTLLFDGKRLSHWRNFKKKALNKMWVVDDGAIHLTGAGGGDILSRKSYKNFELMIDWKISSAGNSGIFILADERGKQIYSHAPEIQILDNEKHSDNKIDSHLSGSIYDLVASPKASHKIAGEWNRIRVVFNKGYLIVWQNQIKTTDIVIASDIWNALVAKSKFATWNGFGINKEGHIGLQDHGDPVWFKNIKIREL